MNKINDLIFLWLQTNINFLFWSTFISNFWNLSIILKRPRHLTQNSFWSRYRMLWCWTTRLKIFENLKPAFLYSRALYIFEDIEAFWYDSLYSVDEIPSKCSALTLEEEFLNLKKTGNF